MSPFSEEDLDAIEGKADGEADRIITMVMSECGIAPNGISKLSGSQTVQVATTLMMLSGMCMRAGEALFASEVIEDNPIADKATVVAFFRTNMVKYGYGRINIADIGKEAGPKTS